MNHPKTSSYFCPMHPEITSAHPGDCPVCGMSLEPSFPPSEIKSEEPGGLRWRVILALLLTIPMMLIHLTPFGLLDITVKPNGVFVELVLATLVVFVAGYPLLIKGFQSFKTMQLNMFSLITLGILAAYFYSFFNVLFTKSFSDIYFEPSAVITTLVLTGQWIEAKALKKTGQEIQSLVKLQPQIAHLILPGGEERKIAIEDVKKGDLLRIKPGEKVPVDGTVKEGQSFVNESMLTGEPIPVFKRPEINVLAGTLNGNNSFTMIAKKVGDDTVLASIIQLVQEARSSKAPIQKLVDKVAAYFTPLVILLSLLTFFGWHFTGAPFSVSIAYAISILIIACPCALGLATPMSMTVGMGLGASQGILIRDASALEELEKVDALIIDKTGTLTEGKPLLAKIFAKFPFSESEVLKFAASVEQSSSHPVAESIVSGAKLKHIPIPHAINFQNIEGKGVIADSEGSKVAVGNAALLIDLGIDPSPLASQAIEWQKEGLTVSFVTLENHLIGLIAVADSIKFTAERTLSNLMRNKIQIIMATGDSQEAAISIAKRLKIDEFHAGFLPQDKLALVQNLQKKGKIVAMAGDGVNDAAAIAGANVGISMSTGSEAAIYNSSITLMKGDLRGVEKARELSKATMQNVKQNLFFAFLYNILAIPLAAGLFYPFFHVSLTPMVASIAMTLSSLSVILNALRLRTKNL